MIRFNIKKEPIRMTIGKAIPVGGTIAETYDGDYTVIPKTEAQTMETKNKLMRDNVTIEKIPIVVAPNSAGGNTVIIGG